MRGGAFLKGKEGRVGFRKTLLLAKDFANERNESLLSNCRVQLILSKGRRRNSKIFRWCYKALQRRFACKAILTIM